MRHDVFFDGLSAYNAWGLILASPPVIAPPKVKTKLLESPSMDGAIDLTTAVRGYPVFEERTGTMTFVSRDRFARWNTMRSRAMGMLQGHRVVLRFQDDPGWYWEGTCRVRGGDERPRGATVTIEYRMFPYKYAEDLTTEPWKWDPFSFIDGVIGNGTYTDESTDPPTVWQGAGAFVNVQMSDTEMPLEYDVTVTGDMPVSPAFTFGGSAGTIIVTVNGSPTTFSAQPNVPTTISGLVLYRGGWLYQGKAATVEVQGQGGSAPAETPTTVTGASIHVSDAAAYPADAVSVQILLSQSFNGYSRPWAAGAGANICDEIWELGGIDNNTGADVDTAASRTNLRTVNFLPVTEGTAYFFCIDPSKSSLRLHWYASDMTTQVKSETAKNEVKTAPTGAAYLRVRTTGTYGTTYQNDIAVNYPSTVTTYSPYSNACPITGMTGASIVISPTEGGTGTEYSAAWGSVAGTVYGGSVDLVSGKLTATKGEISSYNGESLPGAWLSSLDEYVAGTTPTIGAQVVYDLTTPVEYQLTATEVMMLAGDNYIDSGAGDITLSYRQAVLSYGTLTTEFRRGRL